MLQHAILLFLQKSRPISLWICLSEIQRASYIELAIIVRAAAAAAGASKCSFRLSAKVTASLTSLPYKLHETTSGVIQDAGRQRYHMEITAVSQPARCTN